MITHAERSGNVEAERSPELTAEGRRQATEILREINALAIEDGIARATGNHVLGKMVRQGVFFEGKGQLENGAIHKSKPEWFRETGAKRGPVDTATRLGVRLELFTAEVIYRPSDRRQTTAYLFNLWRVMQLVAPARLEELEPELVHLEPDAEPEEFDFEDDFAWEEPAPAEVAAESSAEEPPLTDAEVPPEEPDEELWLPDEEPNGKGDILEHPAQIEQVPCQDRAGTLLDSHRYPVRIEHLTEEDSEENSEEDSENSRLQRAALAVSGSPGAPEDRIFTSGREGSTTSPLDETCSVNRAGEDGVLEWPGARTDPVDAREPVGSLGSLLGSAATSDTRPDPQAVRALLEPGGELHPLVDDAREYGAQGFALLARHAARKLGTAEDLMPLVAETLGDGGRGAAA